MGAMIYYIAAAAALLPLLCFAGDLLERYNPLLIEKATPFGVASLFT